MISQSGYSCPRKQNKWRHREGVGNNNKEGESRHVFTLLDDLSTTHGVVLSARSS